MRPQQWFRSQNDFMIRKSECHGFDGFLYVYLFACLFKSSYLTWCQVCVVLTNQKSIKKKQSSPGNILWKKIQIYFSKFYLTFTGWANKYMYICEQMLQKCNYYKQHELEIQINSLFDMNSICQFLKEKM